MAYLPQITGNPSDPSDPNYAQPAPIPDAGYGDNYQGPVPGMIGGPSLTQSFLADIFRVIDSLREFAPGLKEGAEGLGQLMKHNTDKGYLNMDVDSKTSEVGPLKYGGDWNSAGTGPSFDPRVQSQIGNMISGFLADRLGGLGKDPYGIKRQKALEAAALGMAGEQRTLKGQGSLNRDSNAYGILNQFKKQDLLDKQRDSFYSGRSR